MRTHPRGFLHIGILGAVALLLLTAVITYAVYQMNEPVRTTSSGNDNASTSGLCAAWEPGACEAAITPGFFFDAVEQSCDYSAATTGCESPPFGTLGACQDSCGVGDRNALPIPSNENANVASTLRTYTNDDFGVTFSYPEDFGEVTIVQNGAPIQGLQTGARLRGSFLNNPELVFSGITDDYTYPSEGSFIDSRGYLQQGSTYYFLFVGFKPETDYPIEPIGTVATASGETALLVDANSFVTERGAEGPTLNPGEGHLGAILNLKGDDYRGMVFRNNDLQLFPREDFVALLRSVVVE